VGGRGQYNCFRNMRIQGQSEWLGRRSQKVMRKRSRRELVSTRTGEPRMCMTIPLSPSSVIGCRRQDDRTGGGRGARGCHEA
jgi:hypothetical protein